MRIALYQATPHPLDVAGNLQRLRDRAAQAAAAGAHLLVCPEMYLSGYNIGGEAVQRLAEPADGASAQAVADIARSLGLAIVYGYPERCERGTVYNSVQLVDAQGQRLGNYRKTHLFGELDRSLFSAGSTNSTVVTLDGWRVGLLICYDIEFPENARRLAMDGAELLLVPTANMRPYDFVCTVTVRARAQENQCYLAYANYCAAEGDIHYCGQSSVVDPDGAALALAGDTETLIYADLDRAKVTAGRAAFPYLSDLRHDLHSR